MNKRILQSLILCFIDNANKRADWLRKHKVFGSIGENCCIMNRKVPLYARLIKIGNNVCLATGVEFATHDAIHSVLNNLKDTGLCKSDNIFSEKIGCIEIGDNVFVGARTNILFDVKIGSNVIIGSNSVVTKDIPDNSVAVGIPARIIGHFDDFVEKRLKQGAGYPFELKPINQKMTKELEEYLWANFKEKHC